MRGFIVTMKDKKKAEVLESFNEIHSQNILHEKKKPKKTKRLLVIMSILLISSISVLNYFGLFGSSNSNNNTAPTPTEEKEIPPITPIENPRAALPSTWQDLIVFEEGMQLLGDSGDKALEQALILYDNNKMEEALPYLETYLASLTSDDDDYELRIEAGKIHLIYSQNYSRAKELFDMVIKSDAISKYKLAAKFYLAISQLASGNEDLAKEISQEILSQNKEPWRSKSSQLLELINR